MTAILTTTFYYIFYPFVVLFSLLLTVAAPFVLFAHYVVYGLCLWPLEILAKFEVITLSPFAYPSPSSFPPFSSYFEKRAVHKNFQTAIPPS